MKKVFGIFMAAAIMLTLIAVPVSADGGVELGESWFENASGAKVYDTAKATEVYPVFYANNGGSAITDAKMFLASYDAADKLVSVKYLAAPEIPAGESRIKAKDNKITTEANGTVKMVIWNGHTPIVKKTEISEKSSDAEIKSFVVGDAKGYITNEAKTISYAGSDAEVKFPTTYEIENSVKIVLPADTDVTAVAAEIKVAEGATVSPASGESVDFTDGSAQYTVTAEDGTTAVYTVYATLANYIKTYGETVGTDFPTFVKGDLPGASKEVVTKYNPMPTGYTYASSTAFSETSDFSGTYFLGGSKAGYITASKGNWGSAMPLSYTRKDIEAGKAIVRAGETLSPYYASTAAEAPLAEGDATAETDIAYVLDRNGKEALHCGIGVALDPVSENNDNFCLKFDKRIPSGQSSVTGYTFYQKIPVTPLEKYTKKILSQKFEFDMYLPKSESKSNDICLEFWSTSEGHASSPFKMYIDAEGSNARLIYKSGEGSGTPSVEVVNIPNGCDRWVKITLDVDMSEAGGSFQNVKFYADNVLQSTATFKIGTPSVAYTTYNNTPKTGWYLSGAHSGAKGCVYFDNFEFNAILAQ